jgi:alpha-amylase
MGKIFFLFGLHNHQPVGNFEHVFELAYETCYAPILDALKKYPDFRLSLHHSGPVLEWMEKNRPKYIGTIKEFIEDRRVEILGGGFYEPILSSLPEHDAVGQLEMMNGWIEKKFGTTPRGAWLAERIWDPALPRVLDRAGLEYTLLDDTHFNYAGLDKDDIHGYYITERHGHSTAVFPIDKFLRYSIPFKEPEDTLAYFKETADRFAGTSITYGDDGEKFGLWPDTYDWVFKKRWLERFLEMVVSNNDLIENITYSEYLDRFPARGRIYLPMASYEEMMHWSLPVDAAKHYTELKHQLTNEYRMEQFKPFFRGGLWDNFLVKYEESNAIHKRMIYTSKRIAKALSKTKSSKKADAIKIELYKGQCNCPYWHGLFGGLYLSNLRHAVYEGLINASKGADRLLHAKKNWIEVEKLDYLKKNRKEFAVETDGLFVLIDPSYGGTVAEIDYKPASFNISNVLTRRKEDYHRKVVDRSGEAEEERGEVASPHDRVVSKEGDLTAKLLFDRYLRRSFLDRFLPNRPTAEDFRTSLIDTGENNGTDFTDAAYTILADTVKKGTAVIELEREATLPYGGGDTPIACRKTYRVYGNKPRIDCEYRIGNRGDKRIEFVLGVEWNFTLLAPDAPDREITIGGERFEMNSQGETSGLTEWSMTDRYFGFTTRFSADREVTLLRYPIETVSNSEGGFESNYQGTSFIALEDISIEPGKTASITFSIEFKPT